MSITITDTSSEMLFINALVDISSIINDIDTVNSEDERFIDNIIGNLSDLIYYINNTTSLPLIYDTITGDKSEKSNIFKETIDFHNFLKKNIKEDLDDLRPHLELYKKQYESYLLFVGAGENFSVRGDSLKYHRLILLEKELISVIDSSKKRIREIEEKKDEEKKNITSLNEEVTRELESIRDASKLMHEQLEKDKEALAKRVTYLNELMGKEVGKSLFLTFDKRKKELNKTVILWVLLVLCASGGTFYFSIQLFAIKDSYAMSLAEYIANTIKLIPLFVVLFFCIRQYQRERDFQEEYAFKSAVALTINAYSDEIEDKDKRDDMIIASVSKIYDSPIAKHLSREAIKNKSMLKGIEVMKDTVTGVTKDAVEIVKASKKST